MASPLDAEVAPSMGEQNDLLSKFRTARPFSECWDNLVFFTITVLIVSDMVTDIMVMVHYGIEVHVAYLAVGIMSLIICHFGTGMLYAIQMRSEGNQSMTRLYGCLFLNFPFHLGIIAHRLNYNCRNCESCFDANSSGFSRHSFKSEVNWKFCKIKLMQSLFQGVPQLMLNALHMLVYRSPSQIQVISAALSFASITIGLTRYEKTRKEQIRGYPITASRIICIFLSQVLVIGGRVGVMLLVLYFYGPWLAVVLIPHLIIVFVYYFIIYRHSWRVQYYKIILHSFYCVVSYFPISTDYRPDGEVMMYCALYLLENVVMVCIPYGVPPIMGWVSESHLPRGRFYYPIMLLAICTSTSGVLLNILYACFLQNPHHSPCYACSSCLRHSARKLCPWSRLRDEDEEAPDADEISQFAAQPYRSQTLYANDDPQNSQPSHMMDSSVDTTYLPSSTCSGPPRYQTLKEDDGGATPPELINSPVGTPTVANFRMSNPSTPLGLGGRLTFEEVCEVDESAARPSVLEGDDDEESDTEVAHDTDETPLRPSTS